MPKLSDSNEESVILRWLKGAGEPFARGEPLAEIETDKATVVYEAESDGVLASIVVAEGGAARPGQPIATLDDVATARGCTSARGRGPSPAPARRRPTSAARSARRSTRRSPPTSASSSSARTSPSPAACSRSRPGCTRSYGAERVFDTPISELALAGCGVRVGRERAAAGGRDHVRRLPAAGDGQRRQPDVQVLVPHRRRGERAGRDPLGRRRRRPLRRDPLADARLVVHGRARASRSSRPRSPATPRRSCAPRSTTTTPCSSSSTSGSTRVEGELDGAPVPLGKANVVREGRDVTLVSAMRGVHECLAAAETLAAQGIDAEVVDLRTLRPLDTDADPRLAGEDEPPRRRRGRPADRRLGRRGARARHRARPRRPRRRLAHHHARLARSPTARRSRTPTSPAPSASPPRSRGRLG